jgi:hypothetical protein
MGLFFSRLLHTLPLWALFLGGDKFPNKVPVGAILAEDLWRVCQHLLCAVAFASVFELVPLLLKSELDDCVYCYNENCSE